MATYSSGETIVEIKHGQIKTEGFPPLTSYTVPAGRYARVTIFPNVSNPGANLVLEITGLETSGLRSSSEFGAATGVSPFVIYINANQNLAGYVRIPTPSGVDFISFGFISQEFAAP